MAIHLVDISGNPNTSNQLLFCIDSEADVADLPTTTKNSQVDGHRGYAAPLSQAVTSDGRVFVLGNDGVWREW